MTIDAGKTIGILGPNGAGKSTLLKTIAGLLPPFAGRIVFNGRELGTTRAHERARGGLVLVPEGRQILATLTVRQNLELSRTARRLDPAAYQQRLDDVLGIFPRLQRTTSASQPVTEWRRAADAGDWSGANDGSAFIDARRTDAGLGADHGATSGVGTSKLQRPPADDLRGTESRISGGLCRQRPDYAGRSPHTNRPIIARLSQSIEKLAQPNCSKDHA